MLQVFMNMATGGFGTEVTVKTDPEMKQQLGGAAYIITGDALHWHWRHSILVLAQCCVSANQQLDLQSCTIATGLAYCRLAHDFVQCQEPAFSTWLVLLGS